MKCKRCNRVFDTDKAERNAEYYGSNYIACPHCGKAYAVNRVVKIEIKPIETQTETDDWGTPIVNDNDYNISLQKENKIRFLNPITKKISTKTIPSELVGQNEFTFKFTKNNTTFLYVQKGNIKCLEYLKKRPNGIGQWEKIFFNF